MFHVLHTRKIGKGFSNAIRARRALILAFGGMLFGAIAMKPGLAGSATATTAQQILSNPVYRADDYYLGRHNLANVYTGLHILQDLVAKDARNYEA